MFEAIGLLDDTVYNVKVDDKGVYGNVRVDRLLTQFRGREVEPPGGHGVFTVDGTPAGVLALLLAETEVLRLTGDLPAQFVSAGM